ncbi:tyrosine-type recombinase/integrase [Streptomyces hydrogenans]|uniref:tyrosine-type recombinase/integrase n=1 Tax=Streptomyces hydrogenans TaxID=1873719 RepID=UPI0036547742
MNHDEETVDAEVVADIVPVRRPGSAVAVVAQEEEPDPDAWLPPEAEEDVRAGIPKSTERAYNTDMRLFAEWCTVAGRRSMPAAQQSVTAYMSYLKRTPRERTKVPYSPSSMRRILAAIRAAHRAAGLQPPDTMGANKVIRGYEAELSNAKDPRAKPRKATPADRDVLEDALGHLDRATFPGKRDAALMLLGHAIASRGSELVPLDWPSSFTMQPDGGMVVKVYRVKRKMWQDVTVPLDPDPALCAVRAVQDLVAALEGVGRGQGPLFLRTGPHGEIAPEMTRGGKPIGDPAGRMTSEAASDVVDRSVRRTGRAGVWRSHSLRRGFVKSSRQSKVDIVRIGRHGGWGDKSKALIGYVDEDDAAGEMNPLTQIGKAAAGGGEEQG